MQTCSRRFCGCFSPDVLRARSRSLIERACTWHHQYQTQHKMPVTKSMPMDLQLRLRVYLLLKCAPRHKTMQQLTEYNTNRTPMLCRLLQSPLLSSGLKKLAEFEGFGTHSSTPSSSTPSTPRGFYTGTAAAAPAPAAAPAAAAASSVTAAAGALHVGTAASTEPDDMAFWCRYEHERVCVRDRACVCACVCVCVRV